MADRSDDIGLAEAIAALRNDLLRARETGAGEYDGGKREVFDHPAFV